MNFLGSRLGFWFNNSPFDINWNTSQDGILPGCFDGAGGWYITNGGLLIRYIIQPDEFCGGCNPNVQSGQATATINTGGNSYYFSYNLTGIGENQDTGYENMQLILDGPGYSNTLLIYATSTNLDEGCSGIGPVQQTVYVNPPVLLASSSSYTFTLNFTTNDNLYHPVINGQYCYYECILNFQRA
jgi:hypothetical protein